MAKSETLVSKSATRESNSALRQFNESPTTVSMGSEEESLHSALSSLGLKNYWGNTPEDKEEETYCPTLKKLFSDYNISCDQEEMNQLEAVLLYKSHDVSYEEGQLSEKGWSRGSFNRAKNFYTSKGKINFRIGKVPEFKFKNGKLSVMPRYDEKLHDKSEEQLIQQRNLSQKNWIMASKKGLSPHVFFNGWILLDDKSEQNNDINLYPCNVSEGYTMNLYEYYFGLKKHIERQRNKLKSRGMIEIQNKKEKHEDEIDKAISKQLTKLLNEIASPPFDTVCIDVKPENCVIKLVESGRGKGNLQEAKGADENDEELQELARLLQERARLFNADPSKLEVKLIDWDADFCKKLDYNEIMQKIVKDNPNFTSNRDEVKALIRTLASIISNILMANHFYSMVGKNIFANQFQTWRNGQTNLDNGQKWLQWLFCNYLSEKNNKTLFENVGKHYFFKNEEKTCPELFDELYRRCFILNRNLNPSSNNVILSSESKTGGGKNSNNRKLKDKRKTKCKTKCKTNRKTKCKTKHKAKRTKI